MVYVKDFIYLIRSMGIPPDTKIHLIPKFAHSHLFTCEDFSFYVNFSSETYLLSDFDKDCYLDNICGCIFELVTILGSELVISYSLED